MARAKETVLKALKRELPANGSLLVAVSGGLDSVALLAGCVEVSKSLKLKLEVAHVDHALRKGSTKDAKFVAALAKSYGLALHSIRLTPPKRDSNLEMWGRQERYRYFAKVLKDSSLDCVVTAHTANDVAETLLMRLLSNKELRGIMRFDSKRLCLRPLLSVSRDAVTKFATERNLSFVEDESNKNPRFLRNRVRNSLLTLLEREFNPRISEVLSEEAVSIEQDIQFLYDLLRPHILRTEQYKFGTKAWLKSVRSELLDLAEPLEWRFIEVLFKNNLDLNLGRRKSRQILGVILGDSVGCELFEGISVRRSSGVVSIVKNS